MVVAHVTPYVFFTQRMVFSFCTPVSSAWLALIAASGYQFLVVRRRLRTSEAERDRYRQTIHFVTHEMRTPLTAIQGSSELMGRYALPEEKRKQIAELINSESKRLAPHDRDVPQRGAAFRRADRIEARNFLRWRVDGPPACSGALPLAERKQIRIEPEPCRKMSR